MRIGLMGGSFNPPHEGHRHVALEAIKRLQLHQLWWLVSPGNPLKQAAGLLPLKERLSLARSYVTHPRIIVTAFEASRSRFAVDTVSLLRRRYRETNFIWIGGADLLAELHRWHDWNRFMHQVPVAFFDRPGHRYRALASPAALKYAAERRAGGDIVRMRAPSWRYIGIPLNSQSSTALRAAAKTLGKP